MTPVVAVGGSSGSAPSFSYRASTAPVLSFDSCTLGSSNGSMRKDAPATAVANSQRKNSAPRSNRSAISNVTTGCPAVRRAPTAPVACTVEQGLDVDARDSGGYQPEEAQGRVAAADVRWILEHIPELALTRCGR